MKELSSEALKKRRAYQKKWRDANKEKIKEYQHSYWEKKAQESEEN